MTLLDADCAAGSATGATGRAETSAAPRRASGVLVAGAAVVRALAAAGAGVILSIGVALVVWAVSPAAGVGPRGALAAGVDVYAAAHAMTISLGRAAIDLPPLSFTLLAGWLLVTAVRRGRFPAAGRVQKLFVAGVAGVSYGAAVAGLAIALGDGTVSATQSWRPVLLAVVVALLATLGRNTTGAGRAARGPVWSAVAARLSVVAVLSILGGGAIAMTASLLASFSTATRVTQAAAPGVGAGLGLLLLGLAYLPNAVVAGAGYATGAGFHLGAGTYSPFGSHPVDLPALPLLTAAPERTGWSHTGVVALLVPVLAGVLLGWIAVRRLPARADRIAAVLVASLAAGLLLALIAGLAEGGISGGPWSSAGVPPLPFGLLTAAGLAVVCVPIAALAPTRGGPRSGIDGLDRDELDSEHGSEHDGDRLEHADADSDAVDSVAVDSGDVDSGNVDSDVAAPADNDAGADDPADNTDADSVDGDADDECAAAVDHAVAPAADDADQDDTDFGDAASVDLGDSDHADDAGADLGDSDLGDSDLGDSDGEDADGKGSNDTAADGIAGAAVTAVAEDANDVEPAETPVPADPVGADLVNVPAEPAEQTGAAEPMTVPEPPPVGSSSRRRRSRGRPADGRSVDRR